MRTLRNIYDTIFMFVTACQKIKEKTHTVLNNQLYRRCSLYSERKRFEVEQNRNIYSKMLPLVWDLSDTVCLLPFFRISFMIRPTEKVDVIK